MSPDARTTCRDPAAGTRAAMPDLDWPAGAAYLRVLALLDRARGTAAQGLPLVVGMGRPGIRGVHALCGWGEPDGQGRPTNRQIAQLMIVPEEMPCADIDVDICFDDPPDAAPRRLGAFAVEVNGEIRSGWRAGDCGAGAGVLKVVLPGGSARPLSAVLLTFHDMAWLDGETAGPPGAAALRVRTISIRQA